jgi:hypothetical protein
MNVKEIIVKYLDDNGFDGLCCEDCGCGKDDLFPCGYPDADCLSGYKWPSEDPDSEFEIRSEKP